MKENTLIKWQDESELALKAVSESIDLVVNRPAQLRIHVKESLRDIVTELDLQVEAFIRKKLKNSSYPIIGEESYSKDVVVSEKKPTWYIDPIDGTANFAADIPYYGISLGLAQGFSQKAKFLAGAVALPALKELFFTHGDRGAYLNGKQIHCSNLPLGQALVSVGFSGFRAPGLKKKKKKQGKKRLVPVRSKQYEFFARLNDMSRGALRLGSAATNICFVAAGRLQAALGFNSYLWDVAGGLAIAKQAGCQIVTSPGTSRVRLNYLVGSPSVVQEIMEVRIGGGKIRTEVFT